MIAVGGVTADRLNLAGDVVTSAPANRQNAHLKAIH